MTTSQCFPGRGEAKVQVVGRGVGVCRSPGFGSMYQEGLCDSRQATVFVLEKKQGLRLGFSGLRGRCQVTGSLRVIRDAERR